MTDWRAIPGYEGCYEVSDDGRVRSLLRRIAVVAGPRKSTEVPAREMSLTADSRGYQGVGLAKDGLVRTHRVHRLVLLAFVGPPPQGSGYGCHNNGDPSDNRLENLRWDTPAANQADRKSHGTSHRTHCKNGHEFTEENTLRHGVKGVRRCRACRTEYLASYRSSRAGAA